MTKTRTAIPTCFGTTGILSRQSRQLLNCSVLPGDANERAVAFSLYNRDVGALPSVMDCRSVAVFDDDEKKNPVLVLGATDGPSAVYLAVNLAARETLAALQMAIADCKIELVLAGPVCATSHELCFTPNEAAALEVSLAESRDSPRVYDPDWLFAFSSVVPELPSVFARKHPGLGRCERESVIILHGGYDSHLSALRTAFRQTEASFRRIGGRESQAVV